MSNNKDFDYWFYDDVTLSPEQKPLYNKVVKVFFIVMLLIVILPILFLLITLF